MLTNTIRHSYTHIHTDIQSYTLIHTRYTCSKQLACTVPSTRYDYFTLLQKPTTVHTVPRTKRHHNNRSQGLWSDYLQLTQINKFQDPPPTPLKNFGTPIYSSPPPLPPPLRLKFWLVPKLFLFSYFACSAASISISSEWKSAVPVEVSQEKASTIVNQTQAGTHCTLLQQEATWILSNDWSVLNITFSQEQMMTPTNWWQLPVMIRLMRLVI